MQNVVQLYLSSIELNETLTLQAAEETGRKLKVYAVEKNPNAVITLHVSYWVAILSLIYSIMSIRLVLNY